MSESNNTARPEEEEGKEMQPLTLVLADKLALKAHYMPFLKRGGLFVPTDLFAPTVLSTPTIPTLRPNDPVQIYLQLPDAAEPVLVTGNLAWHTPAGAQGRKLAGVGVHFSDDEDLLKSQIEELLAGLPDNDKPSHTL